MMPSGDKFTAIFYHFFSRSEVLLALFPIKLELKIAIACGIT
jgi:hypothetical protein